MDILVYGAGVLGSVYAARFHGAGHTASILARNQRLADLRAHGIVLDNTRIYSTDNTRSILFLQSAALTRMTTVPAGLAMALVLCATLAGLIGTGLIFTALTDHIWGALIWGLPLELGGLYWCGRTVGQGQRSLRRRRVNRTRGG